MKENVMRHLIRTGGSFLVIGGVLTVSAVLAQQVIRDAKPTAKDPSTPAAAKDVAMPGCLHAMQLTSEQQDQIREIVREYDADVDAVWKQFRHGYTQAIQAEALLLCAIEDNLTEAQRKQVRDQRRKVARHESSQAGTEGPSLQPTDKPESAIEEELAIIGVTLTPEQELAADKIHGQYVSHLRALNRDIEGLHTRLVSLEADKLVAIEKVLTKDQLQQLRETRQQAPSATVDRAATRDTAPRTN
jgi:hypothetical protein